MRNIEGISWFERRWPSFVVRWEERWPGFTQRFEKNNARHPNPNGSYKTIRKEISPLVSMPQMQKSEMSQLWRKDIESKTPMDLQEGMCVPVRHCLLLVLAFMRSGDHYVQWRKIRALQFTPSPFIWTPAVLASSTSHSKYSSGATVGGAIK